MILSAQSIKDALVNENVRAFLRMLKHGEGTDRPDGYQVMFGGDIFENGFVDHPRRAVTRSLGGKPITSTAAGAYQFLSRTWDGLVRQYGFPDFSPESQDQGAVALIAGRKALEDVIAGRLRAAIAKCGKEWASLPGSPYGQPTVSLTKATALYLAAGGRVRDDDAPVPDKPTPPTVKETTVAPFLLAALPALLDLIPKLGGIFKGPDPMAERNMKAVEIVVEAAKIAVNASNEQDLVEKIKSDPAAAAMVKAAVEAKWLEISEAGGGGIDGARKANAAYSLPDGPRFWFNPAFWVSMILLTMPMMLLADVFYVHPESYVGESRTQIVTGILMVIGMVGGYWIGTSMSSQRKTEIAASKD